MRTTNFLNKIAILIMNQHFCTYTVTVFESMKYLGYIQVFQNMRSTVFSKRYCFRIRFRSSDIYIALWLMTCVICCVAVHNIININFKRRRSVLHIFKNPCVFLFHFRLISLTDDAQLFCKVASWITLMRMTLNYCMTCNFCMTDTAILRL